MRAMLLRIAALALLMVGSLPTGAAENTLDYASVNDIQDINPHLYRGEMAAQNMVFEPLVMNSEQGMRPWLAQSWEISPDGKRYTFHLRHGVTFSDGERFDAQAVKQNIEAVLANYQRHAWLELVRQIDSVKVVDDYTVALYLKNPYYPTLVELGLTRPFRFISPKDFINGETKNGVSAYAGTGPWLLAEYVQNQYAVFNANPRYWGTPPRLHRVVWRVIPDRQSMLLALEKGDIQLIFGADGDMLDGDSFMALQAGGKFHTAISEPVASRALVLNSARPITADRQVRLALQYAVDKQAIAQGVMAGSESVADTLLARNVPYADIADLPIYRYDMATANALLDEAGWRLPAGRAIREKQGRPLRLVFSYNANNAGEKQIAEVIQSNFRQVGVDVTLIGEEKQAYLDRQKSGDFDLQYSLSWGKPYDPQSYVSSFRIPAHADYQGQKGLPGKAELDALIGRVLITPDDEQRRQLYRQIFMTLAQEAVYIPLTYSRTKAVFSAHLQGVTFNPSQYEIPFEKMYWR
ncbi:nickel ABC transporter, nickel/metallophore periplasmic binding protein [Brenneria goodwinii]|uniref:Nickel ABC transporter, nickel/metallophore periplasmic binding protein n=2 Tax=Bacteria TaxID=2 RepID=A0AAE8ET69_9GAMM|nr:nickel ABC transporter substrate-binding protein [Brenneria goodwinii]RLM28313.1 nickel ABC transporter, nickel/metallophore periplasmic binding protein [Brenneria goodwinii]